MFRVIDIETTGLNDDCEIAQLSFWTLDEKLRTIGFKNLYFNISSEMPKEAYKVNHLTKERLEQLSGGVYFKDRKQEILDYLKGYVLVAHNAEFEKRILNLNLDNALQDNEWLCTMKRYTPTLAIKINNGDEYKFCKLTELFNYAVEASKYTEEEVNEMYLTNTKLKVCNFHDALYDSFCTAFSFYVLG